jgi:RNA polymerase sigma-70 factor (ECF subfamily)
MLRHFTRCNSYEMIAQITAVPLGTVRSRLNRARSRLAEALVSTVAGTAFSHAELVDSQRQRWEEFYRILHKRPLPGSYQDLFSADVDVRDTCGTGTELRNGQPKNAAQSQSGCARRSSTCWPPAT